MDLYKSLKLQFVKKNSERWFSVLENCRKFQSDIFIDTFYTSVAITAWKSDIWNTCTCTTYVYFHFEVNLPVHDAPKFATSYKDMLFLSAHSASSRLSRYWFMTSSHCLNTPISQSHWRGFPVNALKAQYNFEQNVSIIHSLANISTNCTSRTEIQLRQRLCRLIHLLFVFILFVENIFIQNIYLNWITKLYDI